MEGDASTGIVFSIVIPTFQRRALVVALLGSLDRLVDTPPFECIVVIDGSTDGTLEALEALKPRFPFRYVLQKNSGAARARNNGAELARGHYVLFIDDDMEADPHLLTEHLRSFEAGAEVVLGHLPLHPASPAGPLSRSVGAWADGRARRLKMTPDLTLHDMLTGQISMSRRLFREINGFDDAFTKDGTFGNEDIDLGFRLLERKSRIVFNAAAITWQNYSVTPAQHLRQWHDAGKADVEFARKHPFHRPTLFELNGANRRSARRLLRPMARLRFLTGYAAPALRAVALSIYDKGGRSRKFWERLFFLLRDFEYWRGVEAAGGMPRSRPVTVLGYHAVADLSGSGVIAPYGVPPAQLSRQLDALKRHGYTFIRPDEFLSSLKHGVGLPRRPILVTFDDCYVDLLNEGLPLLRERGISAIAFAVSGLSGQTNIWDRHLGAPEMRLLDVDGLKRIASEGLEIGGHSRTHAELTKVHGAHLRDELAGGRSDLLELGLGPVRFLAYPYGSHDRTCEDAANDAGYAAAFAINDGLVVAGSNHFALPRFEVQRRDTVVRLRWRFFVASVRGWLRAKRA